uniref:Superoxide dismutase [Cu-Zn] n=1 Tax=Diabrotica virgifera virgifera TaxID=50390 RepID=A0A6P7GUQ2_DIAVI
MIKNALFAAILAIAYAKQLGIVYLFDPMKKTGVTGDVRFEQKEDGILVAGLIKGLRPYNRHGLHVHQEGNISPSCLSAGGHFNPTNNSHGGPEDEERHTGDFGNIKADVFGFGQVYFIDKRITFQGNTSIIGRSLVVHTSEDNLGHKTHTDSKITGNAGGRLACGVIGIWNN